MRTRVRIVTAAAASAAVLTTPALADAAEWRGKTEQGRDVYVRTGSDAVVRVRIRGTLSADLRRWSGTFRGRVSIRRNGRQIDSCRVRGVSWRARLRD